MSSFYELRDAALSVASVASMLCCGCRDGDGRQLVDPQAAFKTLLKRLAELSKATETVLKLHLDVDKPSPKD